MFAAISYPFFYFWLDLKEIFAAYICMLRIFHFRLYSMAKLSGKINSFLHKCLNFKNGTEKRKKFGMKLLHKTLQLNVIFLEKGTVQHADNLPVRVMRKVAVC